MSSRTALLRIALRDALAAKGRSALIIAMIALPIAAIVGLQHLWGDDGNSQGSFPFETGTPTATAISGLLVTMIVLETVLLAGPAFAVGLRRQRLLLARISAAGGTPGQLRAVVLGGGLVLGAIAAVTGTVLGFGLALGLRAIIEPQRATPLHPWTFRPGGIVFVVVLALVSALAAAWLPARDAGRTDPAAVLAGRREEPRVSRGVPVLGALLIVGGLGFIWATLWELRELGPALGTVPLVLGFVLLTPMAVAVCAHFAGRLPLPLRIAVRDAGRNRARTAPAVAAVMATVAAFTALSIGMASDLEQERLEYVPRTAEGNTVIGGFSGAETEAVAAAASSALPGATVHRLAGLDESVRALSPDCSCSYYGPQNLPFGTRHLVGGPETAALLLGVDDPTVNAALTRGEAVVFDRTMLKDARVRFAYHSPESYLPDAPENPPTATPGDTAEPSEAPVFPATLSPRPVGPELVSLLPPALADRTDLPTRTTALIITKPLTDAQADRLKNAIAPFDVRLYTETGYHRDGDTVVALALTGTAAFLVLLATLIATALAAADSRPDMTTLTVLGARPRTLRLIRASQTAFVALLGCALGLLAGLPPGIAVTRPLTTPTDSPYLTTPHGPLTEIPWLPLTALCLALPLLTSLLAAASPHPTPKPPHHPL
ncbi:FtsX-like permease family protein [Actinocorallia sp. A-T 12471]|uniref:FtsX-like permease family protein n=1 Tax=Actinocorallia sp. A-T 12471 TaxID=3089813 RepID=UPI0029CCA5DF|nr:FtsX-like permease family protein [Actinocorallia sp. A-T 12471]MDX6739017.1 FtsX-like permease family protein [Actinocorallia sp. A-T 12471]